MATKSLCSIRDCGKPARARGYCSTHYSRFRLHGDAEYLACPPNGTLAEWIEGHVSYNGDQCLIWPFSRMPKGYACAVTMNGEKTYAHRHMCRLAHGEPPSPDMDTAHSCGNGHMGCINPRHLRWASRTENMADQILHGRTQRGSSHVGSRLTDDEVRTIRSLVGSRSQREIAEAFFISQSLVSAIVNRKKWAWLE